MYQKVFKVAILGPPGSGKSTVSPRIKKHFKLHYISSGDLLRQQVLHASDKDIGKKLADILSAGKLVDDRFIIKQIMNKLGELKGKSWLLDGFPRTIHQCKTLWKVHQLDCVFNLVVPIDVIVDRISKRWIHLPSGRVYNLGTNSPKIVGKDDVTGEKLIQREDDTPAVVKKRIKYYELLMPPVRAFFREKGILHDIEGKTSNDIWCKIRDVSLKYRYSIGGRG